MAENVTEGDPLGALGGTAFQTDSTSKVENPNDDGIDNFCKIVHAPMNCEFNLNDRPMQVAPNTDSVRDLMGLKTFDNFLYPAVTTCTSDVQSAQRANVHKSASNPGELGAGERNLIDFSPQEEGASHNKMPDLCRDNCSANNANICESEVGDPQRTPPFLMMYLGSAVLDRRYPPQSIMPWVMAEVRHRKDRVDEITLKVLPHSLKAVTVPSEHDVWHSHVVFEHTLHSVSRFAKTRQEPRCFAYLTRPNFYSDFECHVFLAHEEKTVSD